MSSQEREEETQTATQHQNSSLITVVNHDFSALTRVPLSLNGLERASLQLYKQGLPQLSNCYRIEDLEGRHIDMSAVLGGLNDSRHIKAIKLVILVDSTQLKQERHVYCRESEALRLCSWCMQYYGSAQTLNLCSVCHRFKVQYGHQCFDAREQQEILDREWKKTREKIELDVSRMVLNDDEFNHLKRLVRKTIPHRNVLCPREQAQVVDQLLSDFILSVQSLSVDSSAELQQCRGLSARQASELYTLLRMDSENWRLEHVLCSRVADRWNITEREMKIGHCHYHQHIRTNTKW